MTDKGHIGWHFSAYFLSVSNDLVPGASLVAFGRYHRNGYHAKFIPPLWLNVMSIEKSQFSAVEMTPWTASFQTQLWYVPTSSLIEKVHETTFGYRVCLTKREESFSLGVNHNSLHAYGLIQVCFIPRKERAHVVYVMLLVSQLPGRSHIECVVPETWAGSGSCSLWPLSWEYSPALFWADSQKPHLCSLLALSPCNEFPGTSQGSCLERSPAWALEGKHGQEMKCWLEHCLLAGLEGRPELCLESLWGLLQSWVTIES